MSYVLFGGVFDPPHAGHMEIARAALKELAPEKIFWIPSKNPPHRQVEGEQADVRFLMLKEWAGRSGGPHEISDIEIRDGHSGYTVETVESFSALFPGKKLYLLVGSDEAECFQSWKDWERILELAELAVARRKKETVIPGSVSGRAVMLHNRIVKCCSTEIRRRLRESEPVDECLDPVIYRYIKNLGLYKQNH